MALRLQDCSMSWEVLGLGFPLPPSFPPLQPPSSYNLKPSLPFSLQVRGKCPVLLLSFTVLMAPAWLWDSCLRWPATSTSPLDTAKGRWPFIPQMSDGHHEQQGLAVSHLVGEVSKLLGRTCLYPSAPPRLRSGCMYVQVGARLALAVCGESCEAACRLAFLPLSCPLLVLRMGKV